MVTDIVPTVSAELVEQINTEHQLCQDSYWQGLNHARRCGELLAIARQSIPHGQWITWINDNCSFARRTASDYLRIAREWVKLQPFVSAARLSFRDALTLLGSSDEELDEEESTVVDGEFVEEAEIAPPPKPATLQAGDRCQVSKQGHLHNGKEVEVLEKQSGFYVAKTPEGHEYPFLPTELRPVESGPGIAPPPAPDSKPTRTQRLEKLLERCLAIAGLPDDLNQEIRQELKLPQIAQCN